MDAAPIDAAPPAAELPPEPPTVVVQAVEAFSAEPLPSNVVVVPGAGRGARTPIAEVEVEEIPVERRTRRIDDDIDAQLLPIFLEEAQELVPAVGQTLRDWQEHPENPAAGHALQRVLHTLKGSARMCGAMALGELTHSMETRVENALGLPQPPGQPVRGPGDVLRPHGPPVRPAAESGRTRRADLHRSRGGGVRRRRVPGHRDACSRARRGAASRRARRGCAGARTGRRRAGRAAAPTGSRRRRAVPRHAARPRRHGRPPGQRGRRGVDRALAHRRRTAHVEGRAVGPHRERHPPARPAARDRDRGRSRRCSRSSPRRRRRTSISIRSSSTASRASRSSRG